MVVYYLLTMCLFADIAYVEVLRVLVEALRRPVRAVTAARHGCPARLPGTAAGQVRADPARGAAGS
jgi:Insertion element 4 transposase N-terminal